MALTVQQQIYELVKKSENILIALDENTSGDSIGSALAMALMLEKMGKSAEIASIGTISDTLSFLPAIDKIKTGIKNSQDFIISIDTKENPIEEIRYESSEEKLNIYLTGKIENLTKEKITAEPCKPKYDLIIILDSPDLASLGSLYNQNSELFFSIPIINIDHHPSNEYFGKINLVDIVASSAAEIVIKLFYSIDKSLLDEKIATCLLAGIISETNSFQGPNTTPATLICAANLIIQGANQEQIMHQLYKTKPIAVLKLLGRIMAGLRVEPDLRLGWTFVNRKDFWKTKTGAQNLNYVIEELIRNSADLSIILLLWKKNQETSGKIYLSDKDAQSAKIVESLKQIPLLSYTGKEKNIVDFIWHDKNIFKAKKVIINKIKKLLTV